MVIKDWFSLFRVEQWIKNLLVFIPIFFARKFLEVELLWPVVLTFLAFCFLSSAAYIFNDWFDQDEDGKHLFKKTKLIFINKVGKKKLLIAVSILLTLGMVLMILINVFWPFIMYILINIVYSLRLKDVPYVELFVITLFYIFRIEAGSLASEITTSGWLFLMTILGSLTLISGKRMLEIKNAEVYNFPGRKVLKHYSINGFKLFVAALSVIEFILYLIYCLHPGIMERLGSEHLYLSAIFVFFGLIRFNYMIGNGIGNFNKIYEIWFDNTMIALIVGWFFSLFYLIYF